MSSAQSITFGEVDAWCRLMQISVEPWELAMIMAMDDAYLSASGEEARAQQERDKSRQAPKAKRAR